MADFLLHEGPMGYSLFKVVHQPESVGNRLVEVQNGVQDLSKFGKMVSLQSFLPFEYKQILRERAHKLLIAIGTESKHWKSFTMSPRASRPKSLDRFSS